MFHAILDISLLQSKFIFGTQDHNIIDHGEFICTKLNLQYEDVSLDIQLEELLFHRNIKICFSFIESQKRYQWLEK